MTNRLEKLVELEWSPGNPGSPAFPGQPALPARTAYVSEIVCAPRPGGGSAPGMPGYVAGRVARDEDGTPYWLPTGRPGQTAFRLTPGQPVTGSGFAGGPPAFVCTTQLVPIHIPAQPFLPPTPAVPYSPAQWFEDYNAGWNAGGYSKAFLEADGKFNFKARANASGIAVGLNQSPARTVSYVDMPHAWHFSNGVARMVELGVEVSSYGAYAADQVFSISRRRGGLIEYLVDGVVEFESATPSFGDVHADVSLYLAFDYVEDPEFVSVADAELFFEPMSAYGTEGEVASGVMSFEHMEIEVAVGSVARLMFEPMVMFAGEGTGADAVGAMSFEDMTAEAWGFGLGLPPDFSLAFMFIEPMQVGAYGHTAVGSELEFEPLAALGVAGYATYGQGEVSFEPVFHGGGSAYEGNNNATIYEIMLNLDEQLPLIDILVVMNSTITVDDNIVVVIVEHAEMISEIEVTDTWLTTAQLQAIMNTIISAGMVVADSTGAEVWVVNHATGGSTRYENYDFNSYAKIGDQYYGAKNDGVYVLEGDDDEGSPIRASVSYGKRDFFTPKLKRLSNAYFGVSGSGRLFVKVILPDGTSHVYATRQAQSDLAVRRADLGKGLRANYFELELYNEEGGDFELSTVEFVSATIERRI